MDYISTPLREELFQMSYKIKMLNQILQLQKELYEMENMKETPKVEIKQLKDFIEVK